MTLDEIKTLLESVQHSNPTLYCDGKPVVSVVIRLENEQLDQLVLEFKS